MIYTYVGTSTVDGVFGGKGKGIYILHLDAMDGSLSPSAVVDVRPDPTWLEVSKTRSVLYAACHCNQFEGTAGGAISAYKIDEATGGLSKLNHVLLPHPHPTAMHLDRSENFLLVASALGGGVHVITIEPSGELGSISESLQQEGKVAVPPGVTPAPLPYHPGTRITVAQPGSTLPHCVITDLSNQYVLVCDLGQSKVYLYQFDSGLGRLLLVQTLEQRELGAGSRLLAMHPNGKHFYTVNEPGVSLSAYELDIASGTIEERQSISLLPQGIQKDSGWSGSGMVVHPSGHSLYASIRIYDQIAHFAIDSDGCLKLKYIIPSGGKVPKTLSLSPDARFLYSANSLSDSVSAFAINPGDGTLEPTPQVASVPSPSHVVFFDTSIQ